VLGSGIFYLYQCKNQWRNIENNTMKISDALQTGELLNRWATFGFRKTVLRVIAYLISLPLFYFIEHALYCNVLGTDNFSLSECKFWMCDKFQWNGLPVVDVHCSEVICHELWHLLFGIEQFRETYVCNKPYHVLQRVREREYKNIPRITRWKNYTIIHIGVWGQAECVHGLLCASMCVVTS